MNRLVLIPMLLLAACSSTHESSDEKVNTIKVVDITAFHQLLKTKNLQIVDVRTPQEHELSHIPGSINIDYWSPDFTDNLAQLDKRKPVAVYCAAGARSSKAAAKMKEQGFSEIYELHDGMRAWHLGPPLSQN